MKTPSKNCSYLLVLLYSAYTVHSEGHGWCYNYPECGESTWGGECNVGSLQSPLDLPAPHPPAHDRELYQSGGYFQPQRFTLRNNGHSVVATLNTAQTSTQYLTGSLLKTRRYVFAQLHFHWGSTGERGSEHTFRGHAYPMEAHLVHFASRYKNISEAITSKDPHALAVIGVFFEESPSDNPYLSPIVSRLAEVTEPDEEVEATGLVLANYLQQTPLSEVQVIQYDGSLTTPHCLEVVLWSVMLRPMPISWAELEEFRRLRDSRGRTLGDNFRSTQSWNARKYLHIRTSISQQTNFFA